MKPIYFDHITEPELDCIEAVSMSMNIPFLFGKIRYKGDYYIDGGVTDQFPISYLDDKSTSILGICLNGTYQDDNLLSYLYKITDLSIKENYQQKIISSGSNCHIIQISVPESNIFESNISKHISSKILQSLSSPEFQFLSMCTKLYPTIVKDCLHKSHYSHALTIYSFYHFLKNNHHYTDIINVQNANISLFNRFNKFFASFLKDILSFRFFRFFSSISNSSPHSSQSFSPPHSSQLFPSSHLIPSSHSHQIGTQNISGIAVHSSDFSLSDHSSVNEIEEQPTLISPIKNSCPITELNTSLMSIDILQEKIPLSHKLSYLLLNNLLTKLGSENISHDMYSSASSRLNDILSKLSDIINDNSYINNIISNNSTSQSVDSFIFQNIESNIHYFHDVNITDETSSLCNNDNIIDTNIDTNDNIIDTNTIEINKDTNIIHTNTIEINKDTNIIDTNIDKVSMNYISIFINLYCISIDYIIISIYIS